MQAAPYYDDIVQDIKTYLLARKQACIAAGIAPDRIILDPGFCFGKTLQHNLRLLNALEEFTTLGSPLLVGISRKSMLGTLLKSAPADQRLAGSIALAVWSVMNGANIIRAHDVKETVDALTVIDAVIQEIESV
jgi:dihydropteroate synthase